MGTLTEPTSATRPRSLRSTSTIIRFSAPSLQLSRRRAAASRSAAGVAPRATVPLIGLASRRRERSSARNRSGEELETSIAPRRRNAAKGAGLTQRIRARRARQLVGQADLIALAGGEVSLAGLATPARVRDRQHSPQNGRRHHGLGGATQIRGGAVEQGFRGRPLQDLPNPAG